MLAARMEKEISHTYKKASTLTNFRKKRAENAEIHACPVKTQRLNNQII